MLQDTSITVAEGTKRSLVKLAFLQCLTQTRLAALLRTGWRSRDTWHRRASRRYYERVVLHDT